MRPLIRDPENPQKFSGVLVDHTQLSNLLRRTEQKDKPTAAIFLVNGLLELVFGLDELAASSGLAPRKEGFHCSTV